MVGQEVPLDYHGKRSEEPCLLHTEPMYASLDHCINGFSIFTRPLNSERSGLLQVTLGGNYHGV